MYRELNPYNRQLQKSVRRQIETIKDSVYAYRAMGPGDLGYGYSGSVEYIFLTGANDFERAIPRFTLPIVDLDNRKPTIIKDMREFSKNSVNAISDDIKDMMLTKSNYVMGLSTALLFGASLEGDIILKSTWYKAFSFLVTNMLSNELGLDPYDRTSLHITILAYMVDTIETDRDYGVKDFIINNNILLNGLKIDVSDVKEITDKLDRDNLSMDVLVNNINRCSEDRRLTGLTLEVLMGTINKLVINKDGPALVNGFEYPELFIPLIHTYAGNVFLKKTKLAESLKYINRKIEMKDIERELKTIMK